MIELIEYGSSKMDSSLANSCHVSNVSYQLNGTGVTLFIQHVFVTLTRIYFERTNLSFFSLKIQVTIFMRIGNLSHLDN